MSLKEKIQELLSQVEQANISNADELEAYRLRYLSKKGEITSLFGEFRQVAADEKKELGIQLNELKNEAQRRFDELREQLDQMREKADKQDLTRTPDPIELGTRHPLSLVKEEIIDIFSRMGFSVAEGPEIEDDNHVFG